MTEPNHHFTSVDGWEEAVEVLGFEPLRPPNEPVAFRIHVKDHRLRDVAPTLETYFDGFVLSQAMRDPGEATRMAARRYGRGRRGVLVGGHEGFVYQLGPEPEPDDIDPREPAVVTWADGALFVMIASDTRSAHDLLEIAASLYSPR